MSWNLNDILKLSSKSYDFIYIRDPFTNPSISPNDLRSKLAAIIESLSAKKIVDNIHAVSDIYYEDKWTQYQDYSKFMPETRLLEPGDEANQSWFVKKRMSSRSKGVVFDTSAIAENHDEYIIQSRMKIINEYRVYSVLGEIITQAGQKASKTETNAKTTVLDVETLPNEVITFAKNIEKINKFDFVGYDIAKLENGDLKLIEANRGPQFAGYYRESGVNLASLFLEKLSNN